MEHYVYVWRDADGVPFYVGAGKGDRLNVMRDRSDAFKELHARGGCTVSIVDRFEEQAEAHKREIELIDRYKRIVDGGTLVNKTAGGMGLLGYRHTEDVRAKMGESISAVMTGRTLTPEHVEAMSIARRGKKLAEPRKRALISAVRNAPARAGRYKGVCYHKKNNKWTAQIHTGERLKYLGSFATPEAAARAYDRAANERWSGDCYLNFPSEVAS